MGTSAHHIPSVEEVCAQFKELYRYSSTSLKGDTTSGRMVALCFMVGGRLVFDAFTQDYSTGACISSICLNHTDITSLLHVPIVRVLTLPPVTIVTS